MAKTTNKKTSRKKKKTATIKIKKKSPRSQVKDLKGLDADEIIDEKEYTSSSTSIAQIDPVTRYLASIRKYRLLTKEEEQEWAKKYFDTDDPQAAEVLVTSNLRFVVKIAAEYSKFGAKMIDLIQEGNVGLMHAVKEFNPYKDVRLITYAVWWIRGYIQDYLMKQYSMVRIGTTQNQRKLFYKLRKEKENLERMGFNAGVKQLSGKLGISEGEILEMNQRLSGRDVSLDQPVSSSDSSSVLIDLQTDEYSTGIDEEMGNRELLQKLSVGIDKVRPLLNERELYLLDQRVLSDEPLSLQEVGDKYGITREAVRQMEVKLIQKIKNVFLPEVN